MSSKKRELQKKRREQAIRKANAKKSIRNIVIGVVALLLVALIGYIIYYKTVLTTPVIENYSEGLTEAGMIEGVTATDYVTLGDYKTLEVSYNELAPTEEEINTHIESLLETYLDYSTEAGVAVAMGDTINLDYIGMIDGVAFEGGSTDGMGTQITVGQAGFIDDFEEQLVGKKTGDSFDIEVTFPEDYGNEEVNGKDAVFSITLNGIYTKAEFDDVFVENYLSETALTADAYIEAYKKQEFDNALNSEVQRLVFESSQVNEYPEEYIKDIMGIIKYSDENDYEYYNEYYYSYFGAYMYDSLYDYKGVANEKEYEASLRLAAQERVGNALISQAIFETENLTVTSDHINAVLETLGTTPEYQVQMEQTYGKGYIYQMAMVEAVNEYLMNNVKVVD